jgi:hypothetical protein
VRLMPPSCRSGQIGASSCIRSEEERLQCADLIWRVGRSATYVPGQETASHMVVSDTLGTSNARD